MNADSGINIGQAFWTIKQVSIFLNVKENTLYSLVEASQIPHYRIHKLIRFSPDEIKAWIATKRKPSREHTVVPAPKISWPKRKSVDVDRLVRKQIDAELKSHYSSSHGKIRPGPRASLTERRRNGDF